MFKRFLQITLAFVAVALFVLAPIACQQAEQATDTDTAKPAGPAGGKKLMAATPKAEQALDDAGEALDDAGEALEEGAEAVGDALEEGAEAIEDAAKDH